MGRQAKKLMTLFNIVGMLLTGTLNTLCTKIQFTLVSIGIDGKPELFHKPWFATLNMMFAMFLVGIIDKFYRVCCEAKSGKLQTPLIPDLINPSNKPKASYSKKVLLVAVPAAFDIAATVLCAFGMLFIPASVWQMLRGSAVVFSAILSVLFLKRRLLSFNWLGLLLCVIGVGVVGIANVWGQEAAESHHHGDSGGVDPASMVIGMMLVVGGQVVQAGQVVAEEYLMKEVDLPAMQIVGWEGAWGTLMMVAFIFPALWVIPGGDGGHLENPLDTIALLQNSSSVRFVVLLFLFSCATFNATGIAVTSSLSSIHRMMLDLSRTIMIWGFGLAVHVYDPTSAFGEVWTPYSFMQLIGFAVLVVGQSVYGELLKIPGLEYPESVMPSPTPSASLNLMSPLPREK